MDIVSSGIVTVSPGVSSAGLFIIQDGILEILNDGVAQETVLADGGKAVVSNGGVLYVCTVSSGGTATVLNGGLAQAIMVENGGLFLISQGGTTQKSILQSGGTQVVYADVMAADVTVLDGGELHVSPGGYALGPLVSKGGILYAWEGALIDRARIAGTAVVNASAAANSTVVLDGGRLSVLSAGYAFEVEVSSGAMMEVSSGGIVNSVRVCDGGVVMVSAGGRGNNTEIGSGGAFFVSSGASVTGIRENGGYVEVADGANVTFATNLISGLELSSASATVHSGTTATDTTIDSGGWLNVFSGGIANATVANSNGGLAVHSGGTADGVTVNYGGGLAVHSGGTALRIKENGGLVYDDGTLTFESNTFSGVVLDAENWATVHSGTTAIDTKIVSGGSLYVFSGGTANGNAVNSGGGLVVVSGGKLTGKQTFEAGAVVSMYEDAILDFDFTQAEVGADAQVNDLSIIQGTPLYMLTVSGEQEKGLYVLAGGATGFDGVITVQNTLGESLGSLAVGRSLDTENRRYTLNLADSSLTVTVEASVSPVPTNLVGTKNRVSWDPTGAEGYVMECSTDDFAHVLQVDTTGNAVDMLDLPAGTYQWRVRMDDGEAWAVGNSIVSDNDNTPQVLQSNADGSDDLFFATPVGTWGEEGYLALALHIGSVNDWTGTREIVSADGKGRIQNLFFGSSDPNVLCLTDADNGDAIFVDDVYTDLPEGVEELTSRLYKIQEIRAGAGDDIVDMTSQRFEYIGEGMTIRGGDGSDIIWASKGDNLMFGDAGDDRIVGASGNDVIAGGIGDDHMHGGGNDDVFTFCDNWGMDTVEQLESGTVTLWFIDGDIGNWDEAKLTYTDGENSVIVKGVASSSVTLKFGENAPDDVERFATLSGMGAFLGFTSQRVFEGSGKGSLASQQA